MGQRHGYSDPELTVICFDILIGSWWSTSEGKSRGKLEAGLKGAPIFTHRRVSSEVNVDNTSFVVCVGPHITGNTVCRIRLQHLPINPRSTTSRYTRAIEFGGFTSQGFLAIFLWPYCTTPLASPTPERDTPQSFSRRFRASLLFHHERGAGSITSMALRLAAFALALATVLSGPMPYHCQS
ncbi:hypothetical protein EI94DRAFT_1718172 [Lactarius quietus]|nr:hypothetical protein EI94DRAFT_1718172 [Lactarius quietus]